MADKVVVSKTDFLAFLKANNACAGALRYVEVSPYDDAKDIYEHCDEPSYIDWLGHKVLGVCAWESSTTTLGGFALQTKAFKKAHSWAEFVAAMIE